MNITKIIETTQEEKIDITEITLISAEEFEEAREIIPPCNEVWWWTRTPDAGYASSVRIVYAGYGGALSYDHAGSSRGVRPLAIFNPKSSNLKSPDRFKMSGETWTVIAEGKALCDRCVDRRQFRKEWSAKDANMYEKSDVKKWLDEWARKIWEEEDEQADSIQL